eukprot:2434013-Rhodomonas_salina.1
MPSRRSDRGRRVDADRARAEHAPGRKQGPRPPGTRARRGRAPGLPGRRVHLRLHHWAARGGAQGAASARGGGEHAAGGGDRGRGARCRCGGGGC